MKKEITQIGKKRNLVLLQAFPANKANSIGPIKFFEQFFNVHFIEVPGFKAGSKPLPSYEINKIAKSIKSQIDALNLSDYAIGGLSFGCYMINKIDKLPAGCKAIIYLEPYFGAPFLKIEKKFNKTAVSALFKLILRLNLSELVWKSSIFRSGINSTFGKGMKSFVSNLLNQVHPRAFFELGSRLLVQPALKRVRKDIPTILVMNPESDTLKASETIAFVRKSLKKSKTPFELIYTGISHNAENFTYYKKTIKKNEVDSMLSFIDNYYTPSPLSRRESIRQLAQLQ